MNFIYPLVVILLAVFAIAPLEYPGAFQSHSGLSAVYNLIHLDQNPLQFFNWAPTFGAHYDLFRTEGPLAFWLAEIFHYIGFGYLDAIKVVYALAWIASGLTMFALAKHFFSDASALLASTVYIYLPFHIVTVYVRGALAESVAWVFFPLALQSITNDQSPFTRKAFVSSLLPFALLYLAQPGIAILFSLFALAVALVLNLRSRNSRPISVILYPLLGILLGALLSIPLWARSGARFDPNLFIPDFILPYQLFASSWAVGDLPASPAPSQGNFIFDRMPFQLGVAAIGLTIIAAALNARIERANANAAPAKVLLIAAIPMAILTFSVAAPIWSVLGIFAAHPWQLLSFIGVVLAFVAGSVLDTDARWQQPAMLAFFAALPVVSSYGYLLPRYVDMNPVRPQIAIYGNNEIALLDYRIVGPLRHGATVRIELKWQALKLIDRDYTVFVHAVSDDAKTYAQVDNKPQNGALPTIKWKMGEIIYDTHTIQIDVDGPREGYHLELGLYQAVTGERVKMQSGADILILPRPGDPPPTISDQLPSGK